MGEAENKHSKKPNKWRDVLIYSVSKEMQTKIRKCHFIPLRLATSSKLGNALCSWTRGQDPKLSVEDLNKGQCVGSFFIFLKFRYNWHTVTLVSGATIPYINQWPPQEVYLLLIPLNYFTHLPLPQLPSGWTTVCSLHLRVGFLFLFGFFLRFYLLIWQREINK